MILSVSVSSTITLFASRWVSVRKQTSAAAKRKREHAGAPKAPISLDIQNDGIDRLLRVEEWKTGIVGFESVNKEATERRGPEARGANVSGSIGYSEPVR